MKAVILLAGMGSRLAGLTATTPKSLLPMGETTILEQMITKLTRHGVSSIVVICGYLQEVIERYLATTFPSVDITIVRNSEYATTNTGYSLLRAREQLEGKTFIKLDGDVVFAEQILERLVLAPGGFSYACVDHTAVDAEVIKVQCSEDGLVLRIGNDVPVADAVGESIGIERIDERSTPALFATLDAMMNEPSNHQNYYEVAYDAIVRAGEPFKALDITGSPWVEIDTAEEYERAQRLFRVP